MIHAGWHATFWAKSSYGERAGICEPVALWKLRPTLGRVILLPTLPLV
jgi:hypothetical protein